jgi:predicted transcriptional regulator
MRESTVKVLDDDDLKFVDILHSLGIKRTVAILITYLASTGEATSREIELGAGLKQPEVSIAMRALRGENWVSEREVKTGGKGRPLRIYSLSTPIGEIIQRLEDEKQKESAETMENVQKLRDLTSS